MGKAFVTDEDKMYDFALLSKEDFLLKYYYIKIEDYDTTKDKLSLIEIPSICDTKYGELFYGFLLHKKSIMKKAYTVIVCLNKGILNKDNLFDGIEYLQKDGKSDSYYDEWDRVGFYFEERL